MAWTYDVRIGTFGIAFFERIRLRFDRNSGLIRSKPAFTARSLVGLRRMSIRIRLSKTWPYDWLIIAFLASETISTGFEFVFSKFDMLRLAGICTAIITWTPFLFVTLLNIKKAREEARFIVIYVAVFVLLMINLMLHPDYGKYYTRPVYGAYTVVFGLNRGALWGMLVFAVARKTNNVLSDIHISAILLFVYCLYRFYRAKQVGYWEAYNDLGILGKSEYNLVFGYKVIFCAVVFLYFFLERKNLLDLMGAAIALLLDIKEGSRGSLICLIVFVILYMFVKITRMKLRYKVLISLLLIMTYVGLTYYYSEIVSLALRIIQKLHIQSRTINMLLSGDIMDDNGRAKIAELSWRAIHKQGFFGMGPFGCRTVIAPYYNYGYPHNIALELILDYGWFVAIGIMAWLIIRILRSFIHADKQQNSVLIIVLSMCVKLLISGSYWSEPFFWGLLGWTSVCLNQRKRKFAIAQLLSENMILSVRDETKHE